VTGNTSAGEQQGVPGASEEQIISKSVDISWHCMVASSPGFFGSAAINTSLNVYEETGLGTLQRAIEQFNDEGATATRSATCYSVVWKSSNRTDDLVSCHRMELANTDWRHLSEHMTSVPRQSSIIPPHYIASKKRH